MSGENQPRRVTFHHVPVREGQDIYVQPNEQVVAVDYDSEGGYFHAVILATHDGAPDGGSAVSSRSGGSDG